MGLPWTNGDIKMSFAWFFNLRILYKNNCTLYSKTDDIKPTFHTVIFYTILKIYSIPTFMRFSQCWTRWKIQVFLRIYCFTCRTFSTSEKGIYRQYLCNVCMCRNIHCTPADPPNLVDTSLTILTTCRDWFLPQSYHYPRPLYIHKFHQIHQQMSSYPVHRQTHTQKQ